MNTLDKLTGVIIHGIGSAMEAGLEFVPHVYYVCGEDQDHIVSAGLVLADKGTYTQSLFRAVLIGDHEKAQACLSTKLVGPGGTAYEPGKVTGLMLIKEVPGRMTVSTIPIEHHANILKLLTDQISEDVEVGLPEWTGDLNPPALSCNLKALNAHRRQIAETDVLKA